MITMEDIEKAFAERVAYRLSPWSDATALRRPTLDEVKQRLLSKIDENITKGAAE
ncbi:hypothetical protein G6K96_21635 [Agrobacterium vitis]|uniref:hypothetical protein n=1 Tax=Agrobacterium vitis TaxID=373 RepID=UPI0015737C31|nr:hypothetical protein [Agrobacterium vitis]NTA34337.1 hypothetical protein [Agrobacterium vitis]